ncbi:glyoxal reductase [Gigaspora margarita]|uniref:Glyoxal reductase n=1 Tax=Gigaspora margarita TaxID=4874 RepID=A0A8H4ASL6_GIGMA|nr:glyoxal reductase [Gigaspora margarita]
MDLKMESTITLNNGNKIPVIGLGLFQTESGQTAKQATLWALEAGYRHLDTAAMYANEKDVGIAIAESKIPREDIFITTKIWNTDQGYELTLKAADTSLKNLQSGYIDLLLLHSPLPGPQKRAESYKALQELVKRGLVKSIGVSNYGVKHLQELLDSNPEIKPAVNQVEIHPWLTRSDIVSFCNKHNIVVEAYSPLTRGKKLNDPILTGIANKYGKTPAQILVRWGLQHNFVILPKSTKLERIIENANVFDFEIKKSDMETLDGLDEYLVVSWDPTVAE